MEDGWQNQDDRKPNHATANLEGASLESAADWIAGNFAPSMEPSLRLVNVRAISCNERNTYHQIYLALLTGALSEEIE